MFCRGRGRSGDSAFSPRPHLVAADTGEGRRGEGSRRRSVHLGSLGGGLGRCRGRAGAAVLGTEAGRSRVGGEGPRGGWLEGGVSVARGWGCAGTRGPPGADSISRQPPGTPRRRDHVAREARGMPGLGVPRHVVRGPPSGGGGECSRCALRGHVG